MDYKITIKQMVADGVIPQEVVERYFPELKESEDERIRKMLIEFFGKGAEYNGSTNGISDKEVLAWLEKQGEQKHVEWSEEDKDMLRMLLEMINYASDHYQHDDKATDIKAWVLKSLKDRVGCEMNCTTTKEWSEEDEQYLLICKNALNKYQVSDQWDAAIISRWLENRLESIRPRSQWKPSDEQIGALEHFVRSIAESGFASPYDSNTKLLYSLLSDLKKLKG